MGGRASERSARESAARAGLSASGRSSARSGGRAGRADAKRHDVRDSMEPNAPEALSWLARWHRLLVVAAPSLCGRPDASTGRAGQRSRAPTRADGRGRPGQRAAVKACRSRVVALRRRGAVRRSSSRGTTARLYTLAPGGDFETAAEGWTLGRCRTRGGRQLVVPARRRARRRLARAGRRRLGASARRSASRRGFPSFRFVARSVGADGGVLRSRSCTPTARRKKAGRVMPGADWAPTRKVVARPGPLPLQARGVGVGPAALHRVCRHRARGRRVRRSAPAHR